MLNSRKSDVGSVLRGWIPRPFFEEKNLALQVGPSMDNRNSQSYIQKRTPISAMLICLRNSKFS